MELDWNINRICKQLRVKSFSTVTIKKKEKERGRKESDVYTRPDIFALSPTHRVVPNLSLNGCSRLTVAWTRDTQRIFYRISSFIVPGVALAPPSVYGRHYVGYVNGPVPRCKIWILGCLVSRTASFQKRLSILSKYIEIIPTKYVYVAF